jgi:hypothetical protein
LCAHVHIKVFRLFHIRLQLKKIVPSVLRAEIDKGKRPCG